MLVSDEFILEEIDIDDREIGGEEEGVELRYNQTNPSIIRDGIDSITVVEEDDDKYRVDYWGYMYGRMYITADGVKELGQLLATEEDKIPSWTLNTCNVDADNPPWWLPEGLDIDPTVHCDACDETISVQHVVTPQNPPAGTEGSVFCRDCWENLK